MNTATAILILLIAWSCCSGCAALKQMAPNQWNVTVPTGFSGKPAAQGIWVGVGGALTWGKQ